MLRPNVAYNLEIGRSQMKYAVIYETGPEGGYSAYVPDLPGSVARREHERKLASSWKGRSNSISEDAIA